MVATELSVRETCPVCGFRPSTVAPADAATALRSFPRRFRERIEAARLAGKDGAELVVHAAKHLTDAVKAIEERAEHLERVLRRECPRLDRPSSPPAPPHGVADPSIELQRLEATAGRLAELVDAVSPADWNREGLWRGMPVTALDLVRAAVHEGVHHLRAVDRLLEDAGIPPDAEPV